MGKLNLYAIEGLVNDRGEGLYWEPAFDRPWIGVVHPYRFGAFTKTCLAFVNPANNVRVADGYDILPNPNLVDELKAEQDAAEAEALGAAKEEEAKQLSDKPCARDGCDKFLTVRQAKRGKAKYCSPECRDLASKQREADKKQANNK